MKSLLSIKRLVRRMQVRAMHSAEIDLKSQVLGSSYGGWPLLEDTPKGALVFSFGIGTDISFDCAAIEKFGCQVHGFDPTPRSLEWIAAQVLPSGFQFHPVGLAEIDGVSEFEPPVKSAHVSFSRAKIAQKNSAKMVVASVQTLESIVKNIGKGLPSVVKMDIEGFEYSVIANICLGSLRPRQLLVEFHHDLYGYARRDTEEAVQALKNVGYKIFHVAESGREYGFVHLS
jgi:FkbM family methyltransferase